ncbi:MAG: hypothetical protein IJZ23_00230 [Roseburia sp.]|nr:hypothetical protein [Roseburia sp.]
MEQVVRIYGKFVLESVAMICMVGFLFCKMTDEDGNTGMFKVVGAKLPMESEDYNAYTDFRQTYQEESNKAAPQITYVGGTLSVGVSCLRDVIKAFDYSGRELEIAIMSIKGIDGSELIGDYNTETSEINLTQAGVYVVTVSAGDDIHKVSQCTVRIPVNKQGINR